MTMRDWEDEMDWRENCERRRCGDGWWARLWRMLFGRTK